MANKIKEFLFPEKNKEDFETSTIVVNANKVVEKEKNVSVNKQPNIFNPIMFSQVEEIANELINGNSVIVDLTSTNLEEAKRICDFLNGVSYSLNGSVQKIAKLVYLFNANKR